MERFAKKTNERPYGTLFELGLAAWLDASGKYVGARGWLKAQNLLDPSEQDLIHFSQKIRRAVVWRGSVTLMLVAGWVALFWFQGVPLRGCGPVRFHRGCLVYFHGNSITYRSLNKHLETAVG
jgi:hypothetical protein